MTNQNIFKVNFRNVKNQFWEASWRKFSSEMKIICAAFPNNERIVGGSQVSSTSFAPWQVWIFTHFD